MPYTLASLVCPPNSCPCRGRLRKRTNVLRRSRGQRQKLQASNSWIWLALSLSWALALPCRSSLSLLSCSFVAVLGVSDNLPTSGIYSKGRLINNIYKVTLTNLRSRNLSQYRDGPELQKFHQTWVRCCRNEARSLCIGFASVWSWHRSVVHRFYGWFIVVLQFFSFQSEPLRSFA